MLTIRALQQRIRELARARGVPLARLAERAGVSRSHLRDVLACAKAPRVAWLARVANALDVAPAELVEAPQRRSRPPRLSAERWPLPSALGGSPHPRQHAPQVRARLLLGLAEGAGDRAASTYPVAPPAGRSPQR